MLCIMRFYLLVMLFSLMNGTKIPAPKFCVNCKYFIDVPVSGYSNPKHGKCSFFPKRITNHLVTGDELDKEYFFASTARDYANMCGDEAKNYKKKYKPREEHSY
jgi:hypothetical protein